MTESNQQGGAIARIIGGLFFLLFGGVFATAGFITLLAGFNGEQGQNEPEGRYILSLVGGVSFVVGLGIMAIGIFIAKRSKADEGAQKEHPESPWLWRKDWREGRITSGQGSTLIVFSVFALIWNAISWMTVPLILRGFREGNKPALIGLLFPLVGAVLITIIGGMFLRARRFGKNILQLEKTPGVIGGSLRGLVLCPNSFEIEKELNSRLSCVNIIRTGSGKNSSTRENLIFETRDVIDPEAITMTSQGMEIPIDHVIPFGLPASDSSNSRNRMIWRLELRSELSGPDFVQIFEVPVFVTEESDESVRESAKQKINVDEAHARGLLFEHSDIGFRKLEDGAMEVYFPAARNKGAILAFFLFSLIWGGIIYALSFSDAPLVFPIFFGFFELVFIAIILNMLFSSSLIHIRPDGLGYEKRTMGFMKRGFHLPQDISCLDCEVSMQSGDRVYYRLLLKLKSDAKITLGAGLPDKAEALALIEAAEQVLGIRDVIQERPTSSTF